MWPIVLGREHASVSPPQVCWAVFSAIPNAPEGGKGLEGGLK